MPAQQNVGVLLALRGTAEEELVRTIAMEPGLRVVRRCADVAELTAAAVAGLGSVAVLDADLGVDRTLLDRLRAHGVRTIVSCAAEDVARNDGLGALALARGVDPVPAIRALAEAGAPAADDDAETGAATTAGDHLGRTAARGAAELPATRSQRRRRERSGADASAQGQSATEPAPALPPRVVAVTGPGGSPGRSTIAINLAHELAQHGEEVVLIDADLWGGAIAQTLGLLAETAGLSAAVRAADHGRLDDATFTRLAPKVADRLRVLPGLARAARWREVSAVSMLALPQVACWAPRRRSWWSVLPSRSASSGWCRRCWTWTM